jgi:dihydroorotase-like cyclic amidohydrolase
MKAQRQPFSAWPGIPETAETVALARNLLLVEQAGVRAHFSQLTTARGVADDRRCPGSRPAGHR